MGEKKLIDYRAEMDGIIDTVDEITQRRCPLVPFGVGMNVFTERHDTT
jgi:hypothetical protein